MSEPLRDHLFISYAWEDGVLAEWLTLKLTAEGYKVWCDRFKLLGGESYPEDIDRAIKEQTFRVLGLLSRHSLHKPNPLKERTLALNLGRERHEDFLIPLNVDGLGPTDLPWMLSDLTYVPFRASWAQGLAQLLRKLETLGASRPLIDGKGIVAGWFAARDSVNEVPERLWTNLLEILELPTTLLRVTLASPVPPNLANTWPHHPQSETVVWAFEGPERSETLDIVNLEEVVWASPSEPTGVRLTDVVTDLLKQYLRAHCLRKGMRETPKGEDIYFPIGLLPANRLYFASYSGRRTWVQPAGERTFRLGPIDCEKTRYHLSPRFRPNLWKYGRPMVQVQMRLHLTDVQGNPLQSNKALRRRKAICKNWWNDEWLARMLGLASWMGDGRESVNLARAPACRIVLAGRPTSLEAPVGINEAALTTPVVPDNDDIEIDDEEPDTRDRDGGESDEGDADG